MASSSTCNYNLGWACVEAHRRLGMGWAAAAAKVEVEVEVEAEAEIEFGPVWWYTYAGVSCFLVLFTGMMSGLTLSLMSSGLVELEIPQRNDTPTEKKQAGWNPNPFFLYKFLILAFFFFLFIIFMVMV